MIKAIRLWLHYLKGNGHGLAMWTKDEWHRDNEGKIKITKREIIRGCTCGYGA